MPYHDVIGDPEWIRKKQRMKSKKTIPSQGVFKEGSSSHYWRVPWLLITASLLWLVLAGLWLLAFLSRS